MKWQGESQEAIIHKKLLHMSTVLLLSVDMLKAVDVICFPLDGMYLVFKELYLASL